MALKPKSKAGAKPKFDEPDETPDLERHDEVFFRHAAGPKAGRVLSRGKHGAVIDADGERHRVPWGDYLGHKTRVRPDVRVVSEGEDGLLVESPGGARRFVRDPLGAKPPADKPMVKATLPPVLFFSSSPALLKAIKNNPGLIQKDITDKRGVTSKRWVVANKKAPKGKRGKAPEEGGGEAPEAGADNGFGTHNLEAGDTVGFRLGSLDGHGEIIGKPGADGAHVRDESGHEHKVLWNQITGHKRPPHQTPTPPPAGEKPEHEGDDFSAGEYGASKDDADATPESILSKFPPDTADKIAEVQARLKTIEATDKTHKVDGKYSEERLKLHHEILYKGREGRDPDDPAKRKFYPGLLSPESIARAMPEDGEKPTLTMLGGRGGSGKSGFKGTVYDPQKAIVLDPDEIKHMLPEYEGWNAHQVHEESGDLADQIKRAALESGLNLVIDATLKTEESAMKTVEEFKAKGFDIEAHFMHLPRQVATHRAVDRFLGKTGRFVPPEVILGNTENEKVFDKVRKHAKRWSFRDNSVERGKPSKLIARGGYDE